MITCKQDLINTAVFCHKGELRELYLEKCREFGIKWLHPSLNISNYQLLRVDEDGCLQGVITETGDHYNSAKRLTLSDLKPRTKVEYEKVTLSLSERSEILESGEWLYLDPDGRTHIDMNCATNWTIGSLRDREVYRKVERPVEWFDDAVDYINSLDGEATDVDRNGGVKKLYIHAEMDEREVKDFARIVLGQ